MKKLFLLGIISLFGCATTNIKPVESATIAMDPDQNGSLVQMTVQYQETYPSTFELTTRNGEDVGYNLQMLAEKRAKETCTHYHRIAVEIESSSKKENDKITGSAVFICRIPE